MSTISSRTEAAAAAAKREKTIIRTSILGILANILLAALKAVIGLTSHSVAVISDAVNNLSDALSSVITILGTKLAGKAPNKKHPLGYGRIEYMTAMIVSAIVLYAGITTVVDSVKKIITPEEVSYSATSLIILGAAVLVKFLLGIYTKKKGKSVNSGALVASGQDAFQDAILSISVLVSAGIYLLWNVNLEAWVGAIIGLFIVKAGIEMIMEAVNKMLGARADSELSKKIRETVAEEEDVHGVYDIIINNYGPDTNLVSLHIEVDDTMTAHEIDTLTRKLQAKVYKGCGALLTAVGIYAVNTGDNEAAAIQQDVRRKVLDHEGVLQVHGFYIEEKEKQMIFDIILDFSVEDRSALCAEIRKEISEAYPDYQVHVTLDVDISD